MTAHPMPHSVLVLDIKREYVNATLYWPLNELQMIVPSEDIDKDVNTLINRKGDWLDEYLLSHMSIDDSWTIRILNKTVSTSKQIATGEYNELMFELVFMPPQGVSTRQLTINYDAIMHQLVTHKMFVKVGQDWDNGVLGEDSAAVDLGVLAPNTIDGSISPVIINIDRGSKWNGFKKMVKLGMQHIAEGVDHLMFLIVLMLAAPLIVINNTWSKSTKMYLSVIKLLKITAAFTIGHSLTLLAGAIGWLRLPSQPVEILIAISILISAIHALKPVFPGKETIVAGSFGLIHGLAFASTLSDLDLDGVRIGLSILGFNLGIEVMQIFVIILFMPWLIILSQYSLYKYIRVFSAVFALVASCAWILERVTNQTNIISGYMHGLSGYSHWIVLCLVLVAIITTYYNKALHLRKDSDIL